MSPASTSADNKKPAREIVTLTILSLIALGFSLQQSLIVPALTTIQRDLHAGPTATTWLVTGFLLSSSVATPIIGRLGDMYGRKTVMLLSLGTLAIGTVLAGTATSMGVLIGARILQGLAGAIVPLSFGIARDELPLSRVAGGIGVISAMLAVGAALGIVFSGPIVTGLGVRWLFWLPLVTLAPTIVAAWRTIPASPTGTREPVDYPGGLLLTGWLVCLLVAVSQSTSWGMGDSRTLGLFGAAIVLFVLWVRVEERCPIPLVDVRLLRERTVAGVNAVSFAVGFTMQSLFTFVTRFVQHPESTGFGLGVPASQAGLVVLPWSVGAFVTGMVSGHVAARFGSRRALVVGSFIALVPSLLLATMNDTVFWICVAMGGVGTGTGLITAAMPAILVHNVPIEQTGVAAGMNQNIRTIGGAIGAQVLGAVVSSSAEPKESLYVISFLVVGAVGLFGLLASLVVPRDRGAGRRVAAPAVS